MTDKPDDVPQWAWDEAGRAIRASWRECDGAEQIARAILQARSQAFEEACKIAENYREDMSFWMHSEWKAAKEASELAGKSISQAIRQHSQKGRDK